MQKEKKKEVITVFLDLRAAQATAHKLYINTLKMRCDHIVKRVMFNCPSIEIIYVNILILIGYQDVSFLDVAVLLPAAVYHRRKDERHWQQQQLYC